MRTESSFNFRSHGDLISFYEEYGYVSMTNVIPIDLMNEVRKDLAWEFGAFGPSISESIINLNSSNKPLLYELHKQTSDLLSLNRSFQSVMELANNLFRSNDPMHILSSGFLLGIPKDDRLVYDFHEESNYMKGVKQIINIHFPLTINNQIN